MPDWIKDEGIWNDAKKSVGDTYTGDRKWQAVAYVYDKMGGQRVQEKLGDLTPLTEDPLAIDMADNLDRRFGHLFTAAAETKADYTAPVGQTSHFQKPASLETVGATSMGALLRPVKKSFEAIRVLSEAATDPDRHEIRVVLMTEGPGNETDKNYYSEESLDDAVNVFEGARCYLNHQTDTEEYVRPEGDIKDQVGYFKDLKKEPVKNEQGQKVAGVTATLVTNGSQAGKDGYATALEALEHAKQFPEKDPIAGFSIRADGLADGEVDIDGEPWNNIVGFVNGRSADLVTRPARGGKFLKVLESTGGAGQLEENMNKQIKELKKLRESRRAETDKAKQKELDKKIKAKEAAIVKALEADPGAMTPERPKEAEDHDDDEPKEMDDDDHSKEMDDDMDDATEMDTDRVKALMPRMADESEEMYDGRVGKMMEMMGKPHKEMDDDEPKEAVESLTVKDLKKRYPGAFSKIREAVRKETGAQKLDFAALKVKNIELETSLRVERGLSEAKKKLDKANIPDEFISAEDLVGLPAKEADRLIARTQLAMRGGEIEGGTPAKGGVAGGGNGALATLVKESGLKLKSPAKDDDEDEDEDDV